MLQRPTMQLETLRADDSLTHVALSGRLDVAALTKLQDRFVFATAPRRKTTIVDLSQVTLLTSMAIGMLIAVAKALQPHGAKMILCGATGMVAKTLHDSGMHHVMAVVGSVDEALKAAQ